MNIVDSHCLDILQFSRRAEHFLSESSEPNPEK